MALEPDIFSRLNTSSVTAIVSDRIYPTDPTENTDWPFVVYSVTDVAPVTTMAGATRLSLSTVQVDLWAKSLTQLTSLADAVRDQLHCYHGGNIQRAALTDEGREQLGDEQAGDIYHGHQEYAVWAMS